MGDAVGGLTLQAPAAADDAPPSVLPATRQGRWQFWRSPPDQPGWARPLLLVVAALAALSYAWGMDNATLETFYGAAVRSMSQSWHNFFFGAFDPWGTVTIDKLPGAFWVQALSVRLFGFHVWAIVLPQAVEGTLTVLVLYRAVRRVAGAGAGLAAAAVLAATPVTILLNRGNISDSLLILLLVLAADATAAAFTTGRLAHLLVAGVWVGLAFQAKMLQAWLVLPALFLAYVLAAPAPVLARRIGHAVLAALVALVVSLSWMLVVTAVPAHDRPYVDGSCNNSVFSQVFLYNGTDRLTGNTLDQTGCSAAAAPVKQSSGTPETVAVPPGPGRFLSGMFGRDSDWMLVPAVVSLGGILVVRRRRPRTDPLRAAAVLWATWLFLTWCFFASSNFINSYYLAAFAPPIAALCGMGVAVAWRLRAHAAPRALCCWGRCWPALPTPCTCCPRAPASGRGWRRARCCSHWRRSRSSGCPSSRSARRGRRPLGSPSRRPHSSWARRGRRGPWSWPPRGPSTRPISPPHSTSRSTRARRARPPPRPGWSGPHRGSPLP